MHGDRNPRSEGLAQAGSVTRWLAAGSLAAVGIVSVLVGRAIPGHVAPLTAGGSPSSASTLPRSGDGGGSDFAGGSGLTPPSQAPTVPFSGGGAVSSGAS